MSPEKGSPRRADSRVVALGVLVLLFAAVALGDSSILTGQAKRRDFAIVVREMGELDAARSTIISSSLGGDAGKIIYIIEDGSRVKTNDVLVRLDPTPFAVKVSQLQGQLDETKAFISVQKQAVEWDRVQTARDVRMAEFDLRAAELDQILLEKGDGPLELARLELGMKRAKRESGEKAGYVKELKALLKELQALKESTGYATSAEIVTEIEKAEQRADDTKAEYEIAERQFKTYRDYVLPSRQEKARARITRAEMNLEQAKKGAGIRIGRSIASLIQMQKRAVNEQYQLDGAKKLLELSVIRAPIPGMAVLREEFRGGEMRKPRVGDPVWKNQALIYLPDVTKMVVGTRIREIDLHKVTVEKRVLIRVDAYPDLRLSGRVESIGVLAESRIPGRRSGEKYFRVTIAVHEKDERLRPGMTARVEILSADVKNALSVPVNALFGEAGSSYCYVAKGQIWEMRRITIGRQNEDWVEALKGIDEGDKVALSRPPEEKIRRKPKVPEGRTSRL